MGRTSRATTLHVLAITLIVVLGAVLRFAELPSRGLIYWDEGKFLLEGVRLETGLRLLTGAHTFMPQGKAIGTAKPTHALLIALSFALLGIHDYAALFLNALASVLAIVLIYRLATVLFDSTVGLVAALVLAVSEYDVIYARSALSESDANALLLLGVLLWLRERGSVSQPRRPLAWLSFAAFVFGLTFTTNYRVSVYVATIVGLDLLYGLKQRGLRRTVTRGMHWVAGCAVAPVAWQLVDLVARAHGTVLFRSEITQRPTTYFSEVVYQIHQGKQARVLFGPLPYLQWYVAYQGWIFATLLAVGIVVALRRHSFPWLVALCPVALPYLLYIWAPVIVPRNLAAAIPFSSILIAAPLVGLVRRVPRRRVSAFLLLVAAVILGAEGMHGSWRLSAERSGLTSAVRYVEARHAPLVLTTNEVPAFYLRDGGNRCDAIRLPHSLVQLAADVRAGYSFALIDHQGSPAAQFIERHMSLAVRYPATETTAIGENLIAAENTQIPHGPYPIPYIKVFRLDGAGLPQPGHVRAQVCSLNEL